MIAGPNGAGKSTFSDLLTPFHLEVIDGDKELVKRQRLFPDIDTASLLEAMNEHWFPELIDAALAAKADFAYETNLRSERVFRTLDTFKKKGYETNLFYIGLSSVEIALERVKLRVKQGGHAVSLENVAHNFRAGLQYLSQCLPVFDRVIIFDNSTKQDDMVIPNLLLRIESGKILLRNSEHEPGWLEYVISSAAGSGRKKGKKSK